MKPTKTAPPSSRGLRLTELHCDELVSMAKHGRRIEYLAGPDLLTINYAHVIMLLEEKLLSRADARTLLSCLREIESAGVENAVDIDHRVGDLVTNLEAVIIRRTGIEVGGRINTGRSRNDIFATLGKLHIRECLLNVSQELHALCSTLMRLAADHGGTILPAYTHHSKHAQPISLEYFLLGNVEVFHRDLERCRDFWPRLNTCPMGAAALATTGFPINRESMADMLGFDAIHLHAYDAISSKDFALEYLFLLSAIVSDMGRLVENLLLWNSFEFGMIELADKHTSYSTIMPQKKNAVSLESIRAYNVLITGKLFNAFGILKAEPWSNGRETSIMTGDYVDTGSSVTSLLRLMGSVLGEVTVNRERMLELARQGFSTTTELADTLVRNYGFPFREAHEIVGLVVQNACRLGLNSDEISLDIVNKCIREHTGKTVNLKSDDITAALDPVTNVELRSRPGGTAAVEVRRMTGIIKRRLEENRRFWKDRQAAVEAARRNLQGKIETGLSPVKAV